MNLHGINRLKSVIAMIVLAALAACGGGGGGVASGGGSGSNSTTSNTTTSVIGAAGGSATSTDGSVTVQVPANALAASTAITVGPPAAGASTPLGNIGDVVVELGPEGTTFSAPVTLTVKYDPSLIPPTIPESSLVLAYASGSTWISIPTTVDTVNKLLIGQTTHFSTYAIIGPKLPYGTLMGSFNGVNVYANGCPDPSSSTKWLPCNKSTDAPDAPYYYPDINNTNNAALDTSDTSHSTGPQWQCTEFVYRYYRDVYKTNIRILDSKGKLGYGNASDFITLAPQRGLDVYPNDGKHGLPEVGDILVSEGNGSNLGHVAIVEGVSASTVTVVEQNKSETQGDLEQILAVQSDNTIEGFTGKSSESYPVNGWLRLQNRPAPANNNGLQVFSAPFRRPAFTYSINGQQASFDASASTPSANITSYAWNFGDPNSTKPTATTTTPTTTHTYSTTGMFTVTLTVHYADGTSQSVAQSLFTVSLNGFEASFDGDFHASTAPAAPLNPPVATGYAWNFDDDLQGTTIPTVAATASSTATHTYVVAGKYHVVLNVSFKDGTTQTVPQNLTVAVSTIGGTVTGLSGTVVLQDNGGDNLTLSANGPFSFTTSVTNGSAYDVTVLTEPTGQTCAVTGGSGTATANVNGVVVACANSSTATPQTVAIGGAIAGLTSSVVLQDNGGDDLTVSANGLFTFATYVTNGSAYDVTVLTQPVGQTCTVTGGSGAATATVNSVIVNCTSAASTAPSVPTGFSATSGNGQVTLIWNAVSGATSYNVYMASVTGVTKTNYTSLTGGAESASVSSPYVQTGLTNGTTYYFVVTAVNANGESSESSQVSATPPTITQSRISAGIYSTCALLANGSVGCWGYNGYGELGNGSQVDSSTPVQVSGITNAITVATGGNSACAVLADYSVRCWGYNGYGDLGNGSQVDSSTPVQVSGITNAIAAVTGGDDSCAVLADGSVRCWGYNGYGELGNGSLANSSTPIPVSGITNATAVSTGGGQTCALLADGAVRCWGDNGAGALGNGSTVSSPTPVQVSGVTTALAVSAWGYHTCAVLADGSVRCWGYNGYGELGNGSQLNSSTPVQVSGITNATAVSTGGYHTCALLADGTIRCWGSDGSGQLGNGSLANSSTPVQVSGITNAIAVSAGGYHTCALLSDTSVRCWGDNQNGQLGNGSTTSSSTPVQVTGISYTGGFGEF